jgi:hypothetical protein
MSASASASGAPRQRTGVILPDCLEIFWIKKIFSDVNFVKMTSTIPAYCLRLYRESGSTPLIVYSEVSMLIFAKLTTFLTKHTVPFEVVHISDEYGLDNLSWYNLEYCTRIYRNYLAPRSLDEFPMKEKVWIFPLGPIVTCFPDIETPPIRGRHYIWSFAGRTNATQRLSIVEKLKQYEPNDLYLFENFQDSNMKSPKDYMESLVTSKFIPILPGSNLETFRLYEALEFGAIPLYIRQNGDDLYFAFLRKLFPDILDISEPSSLFSQTDAELEIYKGKLCESWRQVKKHPFIPLMEIMA